MPKHLYLPQNVGNIAVPANNAHWTNNEKKIILSISDGIIVDENAQIRGVSSIPDIWARPLMFQSALRPNSNHPLRKRFVQEWRGLLSLLALCRVKTNLSKLEIIPVMLDDGKFSTALKNLSPKNVKLEESQSYSWTDILLIKFGEIPIGAFSPTTLVYTSGNYNESLKNEALSLKDENGFLCPPTTREDGLEYIGEWVFNYKKELKMLLDGDKDNPDNSTIQMISKLVDTWLDDIKESLQISDVEQLDSEKVKISESIIEIKPNAKFIDKYRVYKQLLRPLEKEESVEGLKSDISLKYKRQGPYKEVVVITERTLVGNARIWDEQRVSEFGSEPSQIIEKYFKTSFGTKIGQGNDLEEFDAIWIRPELYFLTDTLIKSKYDNFLSESEHDLNCEGKYILPFKKEILSFYAPNDIKEILKPSFQDDGNTIKFSFILPLNSNKTVKIDKIFRFKSAGINEGVIIESEIPVLEIFPNYFSNRWRKYFLFQGKAEEFIFEPVFYEKNIEIDFREHEDYDPSLRQTIRITEILGDNSFPEGLQLTDKNKNSIDGLILIDKTSKREIGLANDWSIGIDFGTSNTNVYKKTGQDNEIKAEKWIFDFSKYSRSITFSDPELRKRLKKEFFVPSENIELPIPTTLRVFHNSRIEKLFLDYGLYIPDIYNRFKLPDIVQADLKWKTESEIKPDLYFESLLFLLLLEVVNENLAKVEIACSYPKAFSDNDIKLFKEHWIQVLKKLSNNKENSRLFNSKDKDDSSNTNFTEISQIPFLETEGVAAGEYFASPSTIEDISERADKGIAALCLDVGGGTTDISVWYRNKIIFDASVLLAGRQISQFIQKNNKIKELLFTNDAIIALNEKKNEPVTFAARLNLVLKQEEDKIREMLIKHANQKEIQWLRRMIAIEFGALAFYTATICVAVDNSRGVGLLERIKNDGIKLHWGGNAAKLISWIDFGKFDPDGIGAKILNAVFVNCLNDEEALGTKAIKTKSISQIKSPGHKSEAAGGLVVMELNKSNSYPNSNSDDDYNMDDQKVSFAKEIVCGEKVELDNGQIGAYDLITNKDLFDGNVTKLKNSTLSRFDRFVNILNYFGLKSGLFNEDTKIKLNETERGVIRDNVRSEFVKLENMTKEKRIVEPIFIMEIKLLFEILNSKLR